MTGASKRSGILYDSHGRGQAALKGDLIFVKPDSPEKLNEFLTLGFTEMWATPYENKDKNVQIKKSKS